MAKLEKGRLVGGGMGGFLNPPGHPEHDWHIETDLRRRRENRRHLSLSYALECNWLDGMAKGQARDKLNRWEREKLPLDDPKIQEWVLHVLGYFRHCYCNPDVDENEQWNADKLIISREINPTEVPDEHAGVRAIRQFYPEFVPTPEHFENAYWGNKPEIRSDTRAAA